MRLFNNQIIRHHLLKHKSLQTSTAFLITVILLISICPAGTFIQSISAANDTFYDFISEATSVTWTSGSGPLSFPGSESDSSGFACYKNNIELEDGNIEALVLETHPQWVSDGWIMGRYPQLTLPENAELNIRVGFIKGAVASDGVTFEVLFEEGQTRQTIISRYSTYDGKMDSVTQNLDALAGRSGRFILYVKAGKSSGQDWAVWAEAKIDIVSQTLPDLVVDKIECTADNKLSVTVKNIGIGPLPDYWTADADVYFDNIKQGFFSLVNAADNINGGIEEPGGASIYVLGWQINAITDVTVTVDSTNLINESNEQNNKAEKTLTPFITTTVTTETTKTITTQITTTSQTTWQTTTQTQTTITQPGLTIISGPVVSDISETAAAISWETSQEADSRVLYDTFAGKFSLQVEQDKPVTLHSITLTGLYSGTSYNFVVYSSDITGNETSSKSFRFTTKTTTDKQVPHLSLNLPDNLAGQPLIKADATDDGKIDRVVFYLNGIPVFTDYSAPFEWHCDTSGLAEGINEFGARAFDSSGNYAEDIRNGDLQRRFAAQLSPMHVHITSPEEGEGIFSVIHSNFEVSNDYGFKWRYYRVRVDGIVEYEHTWREPVDLPYRYNSSLRDIELTYGEHIYEISAEDEYGNWGTDTLRFIWLEPPIILATRDVTRIDNYFRVTLNLYNSGEVDAEGIRVTDTSHGYQCAEGVYMLDADPRYAGLYAPGNVINDADMYWKSTIEFTIDRSIQPGETRSISYYVVPIMVDPHQADTFLGSFYCIGSKLHLHYYAEKSGAGVDIFEADHYIGWSDSAERSAALEAADYLILTCPTNLLNRYDIDDVGRLLATSARLAQFNRGVFGYVSSSRVAEGGWSVKDVIRSRSSWARRLCPNWAEGAGFLLIIGEKDVIPAFDIPGLHQVDPDGVVRDTDYPYSDTYGDDHFPELTVGRIIGETAEDMIIPIRTSLDYNNGLKSFSRDSGSALLVSGPEFGEGFANYAIYIGSILESQGLDAEYVLGEYYTYETELLREALVLRGDFTCIAEPGHILHEGTACGGTHPPTDLAVLRTMITVEEALEIHYNSGLMGDYTIYDTICDAGDARGEDVKNNAYGKNIIYWFGHGGPGGWAWVLDDFIGSCGSTDLYIGGEYNSTITPINFGNSCPVVFAASCLTGAYDRQAGRSIARAFLRYGAGIYIGNVEVQGLGACQEMPLAFFRNFWNSRYVYPAEALKDLKYQLVRTSYARRSWDIYEMNLYGDPKFGAW
ncbi:MAG: C25 family cysteine peptidase [Dehalococcoidales bacterium]|nr:C25 family cysteine peptidase [Dehalococcoidales bacterium]